MIRQIVRRGGKRCVIVEERELLRLERLAAQAIEADLPPLPPADEHGSRDAAEYARASIARSLIRDRRAAGLSQQELARLAGVRQETISRLESGKNSPNVRTIDKIDRALRKALGNRKGK